MILPLTEIEKNTLVEEHKGIVYYMANKFRHVDNDIEEVRGWCYLGLAMAIDEYDNDRDINLSSAVFTQIKLLIYGHYFRSNRKQPNINLDAPIHDEDGLTLADTIPDYSYHYDTKDIMEMLNESVFEESPLHKDIIMRYFIQDIRISELVEQSELPLLTVNRIINKGKQLIKSYLVNNGIISEYLLNTDKDKRVFKGYEPIGEDRQRRVKYIKKYYSSLTVTDIAIILDTHPFSVQSLLDYPTTRYIRCVPDESIKDKVDEYCKDKYPELLPSEVKVYEMVQEL